MKKEIEKREASLRIAVAEVEYQVYRENTAVKDLRSIDDVTSQNSVVQTSSEEAATQRPPLVISNLSSMEGTSHDFQPNLVTLSTSAGKAPVRASVPGLLLPLGWSRVPSSLLQWVV